MKTAVIGPIGLSPPVITEFVDGIGEPVSDVILFTTAHPMVIAGAHLARAALASRFHWIRVHEVELPYDDISTEEQNFDFMRRAGATIREERERYHCERVYLNVAGGRKNMCITLALLGQLLSVDGVFHVVNPDVDIMNQRLERNRRLIARFGESNEPAAHAALYEENRAELEPLMFPPRQSYRIVRIPTLPYPGDYLAYLLAGIRGKGENLTAEDKELLCRHGLMERTGNTYAISPHGERFLEVIFSR
ncbi:MAG: CRISPR-associated protein Csx14 [Methanolinea sp.]|nr:CRISPR-associated protein Csx14 [Methanolinea sp.]